MEWLRWWPRAPAAVLPVTFLAGCSGGTAPAPPTGSSAPPSSTAPPHWACPGQDAPEAARALWESRASDGYRFLRRRHTAWNDLRAWEVTVVDGIAVEVVVDPSSEYAHEHEGLRCGTVERLFGLIESTLSEHLFVAYDPEWRFPRAIAFDAATCYDEEWYLQAAGFAPFGGPLPAPARVEADPWDLDLDSRFSRLTVIEAVVEGVAGIREDECGATRLVEVLVGRSQRSSLEVVQIVSGLREVRDPGHGGPRSSAGLGGQRAILFLQNEGVLWAALPAPSGLHFVGSLAERYGLDAGFPLLCRVPRPAPPAAAGDSEAETEFLFLRAEALSRGLASTAAVREACAAAGPG
ncbi:MAG: DUF6174 domain-containing protein [Actinomycetota bacterium]